MKLVRFTEDATKIWEKSWNYFCHFKFNTLFRILLNKRLSYIQKINGIDAWKMLAAKLISHILGMWNTLSCCTLVEILSKLHLISWQAASIDTFLMQSTLKRLAGSYAYNHSCRWICSKSVFDLYLQTWLGSGSLLVR